MYNLITPLTFVFVFSLPVALLELQFAFIGVSGFDLKMIGITLLIGAVSGILALLIELFD